MNFIYWITIGQYVEFRDNLRMYDNSYTLRYRYSDVLMSYLPYVCQYYVTNILRHAMHSQYNSDMESVSTAMQHVELLLSVDKLPILISMKFKNNTSIHNS